MKISKQELVKMDACIGGLKRFIKQVNGSDGEVDVLSLIGGENTTSDLLWLAGETLSKQKIVDFACSVALINIDKIKPYTDDFELIVEALKSRVFTSAAVAAVDYTVAAVDYTVAAAVDAADAADAAAVYASADAVNYTVAAVYASAVYASADDKINELLIKLFSK